MSKKINLVLIWGYGGCLLVHTVNLIVRIIACYRQYNIHGDSMVSFIISSIISFIIIALNVEIIQAINKTSKITDSGQLREKTMYITLLMVITVIESKNLTNFGLIDSMVSLALAFGVVIIGKILEQAYYNEEELE